MSPANHITLKMANIYSLYSRILKHVTICRYNFKTPIVNPVWGLSPSSLALFQLS